MFNKLFDPALEIGAELIQNVSRGVITPVVGDLGKGHAVDARSLGNFQNRYHSSFPESHIGQQLLESKPQHNNPPVIQLIVNIIISS
jgi:hypothetical protein